MRSTFACIDIIYKRKKSFGIAIKILKGYFNLYLIFFAEDKNGIRKNWSSVSIQIFNIGFNTTRCMKFILSTAAFIFEVYPNVFI